MGLTGIVVIGFLAATSAFALVAPVSGIISYVVYYHVSPESAWWGMSLSQMGVRYAVTITACLMVGTLLNLKKQPYGTLLTRQEVLYLAFLAWIVVTGLMMPIVPFAAQDHLPLGRQTNPMEKMPKLTPFLLAFTHVIVTRRRFKIFLWTMVLCSIYLGYECLTAPYSYYIDGRLGGVGAADSRDANMLAAHLLILLAIVGVQYLQSGWVGKAVCILTGALLANGVVLTQSRGAFVAVLAGVVPAVLMLPKRQFRRTIPLILLGIVGAGSIVNEKFMERMSTMEGDRIEDDVSAMSRLECWGGAFRMGLDHPLGVGPGNAQAYMGKYVVDGDGRDPHNTYIRFFAELGFPGATLFVLMIANAFYGMAKTRRSLAGRPDLLDCSWYCYTVQAALTFYCIAIVFISANYIEIMWWILLMPPAIERTAKNALEESPTGWDVGDDARRPAARGAWMVGVQAAG